jgi:hypothetical protein
MKILRAIFRTIVRIWIKGPRYDAKRSTKF